jgi:hypothetical protein
VARVVVILKMNLRETTVREIIKSQKSRDKLEAKKRRQKQQRTNKNRKKTHRELKVNEQPGLHHKIRAWTSCCFFDTVSGPLVCPLTFDF